MITTRHLPTRDATRRMTTDELREAFALEHLFVPGEISMVYADLDRAIIGGAVPARSPLPLLPTKQELAAAFFLERREIGVVNLAGKGVVTADGTAYTLGARDMLYAGRGTRELTFAATDPAAPPAFFFVSFPAHAAYPVAAAPRSTAECTVIGTPEGASRRTLCKYIHPGGVKSCQLVMGLTELGPGSVWNTMPPHTHARRSEVYLYFDLGPDDIVVHLMGTPQETRNLILHDRQGAISPGWSIHCGAATRPYAFVWAMGGENQDFADMDAVPARTLR